MNAPTATPIADIIKRRVRDGENADYWCNDIRDNKLHVAHVCNRLGTNPDDTDAFIMAHLTNHPLRPAQRFQPQ